ncbi:hypothetical protein QBC46DRAFT_418703 [Diplogelasinospora grovesii]|uniref:Aminoglycoside phosphotransferase domain-containing protein n=1 Tax=Diplogelasinospora grovesii TaxID=303347 RepID=A0AAN6S1P0_9PEZI|nr:hypothetical protein QBC46DRAFT_418703 [Diplogelasinospora grovesii]
MTAEQRAVLAKELGELYDQLRQIRSPYSGRIVASEACHMSSLLPGETLSHLPITIEPYAARVLYQDGDWKARLPKEGTFRDVPEEFITSGGLLSDPPNLPLLEMTARPFNRRLIQHETFFQGDPDYFPPRFRYLRDMMDVIVDEEHVENPSNDFQLVHVDLFPRNIMVDPSSTPMITGIIDWDEAVFAPAFVADIAPAWLWELPFTEDDGVTEEGEEKPFVDLDKESFERSTQIPPTPELQEVKRVWEEAVGRERVESATNPYAILARRFLKIVSYWVWPWWMNELYDETLKEWNKLRDEEEAKYLARQRAQGYGENPEDEMMEDDDDSFWETEDEEEGDDGEEYENGGEPGHETEDIREDDGDSAWETGSEDGDEDE